MKEYVGKNPWWVFQMLVLSWEKSPEWLQYTDIGDKLKEKNPTVYGVSVMLREYVSAHINPMLKCFSFDASGISQDAGRGWNTWAMKLWIRLWPLESPDLKQKVPCGEVWANMATNMVKIPI